MWHPLKPIFFIGAGEGWRTFLSTNAQIADNVQKNYFVHRNLGLLAAYFQLFQRHLGALGSSLAGPPLIPVLLPRII
jgi:hypothetical protein